ncbi:YggS family pyridoxal phosphate-dependent enzyme [Candidatus Woesearchaeota archaeon]|nr:YggS family pyridoxal phosphate-dependent enzyme [Candidatus Woesearchaeota archaeon]
MNIIPPTLFRKLGIPPSITLLAVTKGKTISQILPLFNQGITDIGENRIQEAEEKFPLLPSSITKHFIGHLQSNKVKKAVALFNVIQSVDSIKLAKTIDAESKKQHKNIKIMLQVNIGNEIQKHGFKKEDMGNAYNTLKLLDHVQIIGIMCIAPLHKDPQPYFKQMKQLQQQLKLPHLSMGMSDDYHIAIKEGATMVRIGRKLFE